MEKNKIKSIYLLCALVILGVFVMFNYNYKNKGEISLNETSAEILSTTINKSKDLNPEDDTYISQTLDVISCGEGCENKLLSNTENTVGFYYFLMDDYTDKFKIDFKVKFKSLTPENIYIVGLMDEKVVPFGDKNFLEIKNNEIQTGEVDLSILLKVNEKTNYANISYIALSEEDINNEGSLINFNTVSVMTKEKEKELLGSKTNNLDKVKISTRSPELSSRNKNDQKYLFSDSNRIQTFSIQEAQHIEITSGEVNEIISFLLLDEDFNKFDEFTIEINKNSNSVYKMGRKKGKEDLKFIIINEEPLQFYSKSRYSFVMGERPNPPVIQLMIW